ncbi:V-type ATP synthase subunit E [Imhoffiella purpurea]|uniref:V-type ATP synthase subunit E n=1 Tax=Imhoffiella purpurea TaxID=1249627 RepID=W9VB06_9GAMM|nr:V-type ATP synthase subunit E family protein [Imhoffiella purpurea]EXJ14121.1 H+-transporting two-sector ATPase, E subunit [Imhoffiella purpurea]
MNQVDELERAILARAERLASEYRDRAGRSRDSILREAAERLRLREEREESIARALGERTFHQRVQASEIKLQTHLDRMRWNLVQGVERNLAERMRTFMRDEEAYGAWLLQLILGAARVMESDALLVNANIQDQHALYTSWDLISNHLPEGKEIGLVPKEQALDTLGGVLVTSADGRIRVDHTFEGRLERLRPRIQQTILERLLPGGFDTGNLFTG